jgi:hypothetical protein
MEKRGRKSAASLEVVHGVSAVRRPAPPVELTDEQAAEWTAIVERMPADWFPRETHPMLSQYCLHAVSQRKVSTLIENLLAQDEFSVDDYDKLLKMQEREGRAMSSLATRMRISQQAQYNKDKKKGGGTVKRPWES